MKHCANCLDICSTETRTIKTLEVYSFDTETYDQVPISEALHKVFKPKNTVEVDEQNLADAEYCLCLLCKDLYLELLEAYQKFTSVSTAGSYVYSLITDGFDAVADAVGEFDDSQDLYVDEHEERTDGDDDAFNDGEGDFDPEESIEIDDDDLSDCTNEEDKDSDFNLCSTSTSTTQNSRPNTRSSSRKTTTTPTPLKRKASSKSNGSNANSENEDHWDPDPEISDLKRSKKARQILQLINCEVCGMELKNKRCLTMHIKKVHDPNFTKSKENFMCSICAQIFTNKGCLQKHEKTHRGEKPKRTEDFRCEICSKEFPIKSALESHRFKHTYERTVKCNECGQMYKNRKDLRKHEIRHRNQKLRAFACDICSTETRFAERHHLSQHLRNIHKISREEADQKAGIKKLLLRVTTEAQMAFEARFTNPTIKCTFCAKNYVVADCLAKHLIKRHSVSEEEAFRMCGLGKKCQPSGHEIDKIQLQPSV